MHLYYHNMNEIYYQSKCMQVLISAGKFSSFCKLGFANYVVHFTHSLFHSFSNVVSADFFLPFIRTFVSITLLRKYFLHRQNTSFCTNLFFCFFPILKLSYLESIFFLRTISEGLTWRSLASCLFFLLI